MSDSISISHNSLLDCVTRVTKLGCTLGQDCTIQNNNLVVNLDWIDQRIIEDLESQPQPTEPPAPTQRIDRELMIDDDSKQQILLIEAEYLEAYTAANGVYRVCADALNVRSRKLQAIRDAIVKRYVPFDISGETLIYGPDIFKAQCLAYPDGRSRHLRTLIHFTHPRSAEELMIRESRITAERIVRYRVPGLDDAEWMRQNRTVAIALSAQRLREVICGY